MWRLVATCVQFGIWKWETTKEFTIVQLDCWTFITLNIVSWVRRTTHLFCYLSTAGCAEAGKHLIGKHLASVAAATERRIVPIVQMPNKFVYTFTN